ncbi:hypothetical protein VTP01DRAFT_1622 [Rhizomucor pusillus]|uniref:uncharacterized protein n=1 Tax=Rhizomucor pusillus TaxID=4840 RepID=UPI003744588F
MFLCSYARVVLQKPGSPKKISTISPEEAVAKQDKSSESPYTSLLGGSKWCETCQCWKPDRTHHCRVCDACVLKMDHHCPWVNGCVGYANYRYFIQFICYTSGMATWVFTTTLAAFIMGNGLTTYSGIVIALIVLSGIVMIAIGTFTCSHLWLVTLNRTTIENIQFRAWTNKQSTKKPDTFTHSGKNVFNQGTFKNWTEVMGDKWWQWFFPVAAKTRCNGVNFGYNSDTLEEYQRVAS